MHVSIHTGRNKQPQKTRNTCRSAALTAANNGKKLPNYMQKALEEQIQSKRDYNLKEELPELLKIKFNPRMPRNNAEEAHDRLNCAIDFFNDNAAGYPQFADDIKKLKCIRARFKLLLETPVAKADEAA